MHNGCHATAYPKTELRASLRATSRFLNSEAHAVHEAARHDLLSRFELEQTSGP